MSLIDKRGGEKKIKRNDRRHYFNEKHDFLSIGDLRNTTEPDKRAFAVFPLQCSKRFEVFK